MDFEYLWKYSSESLPTNIFGFGLGVKEDPPEVQVNSENLFRSFTKGKDEFDQVIDFVFHEPAFRDELERRPILLNSLIPIYHVRTLSFVNETRDMDTRETEDFLEMECRLMEDEIYYLIAKWNQTPRKDGIPSIAKYLGD